MKALAWVWTKKLTIRTSAMVSSRCTRINGTGYTTSPLNEKNGRFENVAKLFMWENLGLSTFMRHCYLKKKYETKLSKRFLYIFEPKMWDDSPQRSFFLPRIYHCTYLDSYDILNQLKFNDRKYNYLYTWKPSHWGFHFLLLLVFAYSIVIIHNSFFYKTLTKALLEWRRLFLPWME